MQAKERIEASIRHKNLPSPPPISAYYIGTSNLHVGLMVTSFTKFTNISGI